MARVVGKEKEKGGFRKRSAVMARIEEATTAKRRDVLGDR